MTTTDLLGARRSCGQFITVSSVKNSNDFLASKTRYCEQITAVITGILRNTAGILKLLYIGKKISLTENSNWQPRQPDTLAMEALKTPTDTAMAALLAGVGGVDNTTRLGGNETSLSQSPPSWNALAMPTSSSLRRKGDATIPINQHALSAIRDPALKVVFHNAHPRSTGDGITMVSMTVYHKEHGVNPGSNVYRCLWETYSLLLRADPTMVIPALYEDAYRPSSDSSITSLENFPPDTMGLGNHV